MASRPITTVVISHPSGVDVYQDKIRELAKYEDLSVTLIIPELYKEANDVIDGYEGEGTYRVIKLPTFFGKRGSQNGHFYRKLRSTLKLLAPDVLIVDEEPESIVSGQIISIATGLPKRPKIIMASFRNMRIDFASQWGMFHPQRYLYPAMLRYTLKRIDMMDMCNHEGGEYYREAGYTWPIIEVPQMGINPDLYTPGPPISELQRSLRLNGTVIGFVGRLLEMKGVATLIDAVAGLKEKYTLLLVGWGPDSARFEALAKLRGNSDNVRITGSVPFSDVVNYVRCMDMLVLPSITTGRWKEQFGRVLPEAMACEVPVIGSSSGEIPNVIGDAGLVFPEGDVTALREHIRSLMIDPERRRVLGLAGRARVLKHFTSARLAEQLHEGIVDLVPR